MRNETAAPLKKSQMGVWVDQRNGENVPSKTPTMGSMVLLIAMMCEQAAHHTSLYKRQALKSLVQWILLE